MLNPVTRVKDKVRKHKSRIVFSAGVAAGLGGAIAFRKIVPVHIVTSIDNATLQHLIDHPEDSAQCLTLDRRAMLELFNAVHLENQK